MGGHAKPHGISDLPGRHHPRHLHLKVKPHWLTAEGNVEADPATGWRVTSPEAAAEGLKACMVSRSGRSALWNGSRTCLQMGGAALRLLVMACSGSPTDVLTPQVSKQLSANRRHRCWQKGLSGDPPCRQAWKPRLTEPNR